MNIVIANVQGRSPQAEKSRKAAIERLVEEDAKASLTRWRDRVDKVRLALEGARDCLPNHSDILESLTRQTEIISTNIQLLLGAQDELRTVFKPTERTR